MWKSGEALGADTSFFDGVVEALAGCRHMHSRQSSYVEESARIRSDVLMCEGGRYRSIWGVKTLVRTFGPLPSEKE
jgi:hypothetical protein